MSRNSLPVIVWLAGTSVLPGHSACAEITTQHTGAPLPGERALDDYRTDVQGGVTANSYDLLPLAENDPARTQSMIDGIAGRSATPAPSSLAGDRRSRATGPDPPRHSISALLGVLGLLMAAAATRLFRRKR